MKEITIKGIAHITGGGISENLPRALPADVHAVVDTASWQQGALFDWLADTGNIAIDEMRRTFNCGVGMVAVVASDDAEAAIEALAAAGEQAWCLGQVEAGAGEVRYL